MKHIIILVTSISFLLSKEISLDSIKIISKENGIILTMELNSMIHKNNITAWQATSGWFYLTLYEVNGKNVKIDEQFIGPDIFDFQIISTEESSQLGIKLKRPIENHEFNFMQLENKIIASLYYSRDYFTQLASFNEKPEKVHFNNGMPIGVKKWLYLTGAVITASGIFDKDTPQINNTTITGLSVLFSTLILDLLWKIL
tara:strand:+ start:590 stop:1189 length:600 start_codon:yes stop_codon:yes gene_type:complete